MPSLSHEALLLLFKNRPELAPELLRAVLRMPLPAYAEVVLDSAELTEVVPAPYHADLVVLLVDGKPVFGIVVEAQLHKDPRKPFTWPLYAVSLRSRLECPTCVLVLAGNEALAAWARTPIDLGGGNTFAPLVIGPSAVPVVVDAEEAKRDPELAVLSAMAHGMAEPELAVRIATAAFEGCRRLDDERALLYLDLVGISLSFIARTAFEDLMASGNYEFQSDFAKKHRAAGRAEGEATGEARAVLKVLDARAITVSAEQKARILACANLDVLDRWIGKAVTATSADELFAD